MYYGKELPTAHTKPVIAHLIIKKPQIVLQHPKLLLRNKTICMQCMSFLMRIKKSV